MAIPVWAQTDQASPSSVLLEKAIENNRELLAVRQRVEEARGLLRQAGVRPAPTLETSAATGRPLATVGEEQFGFGIAQTFETAGKRSKRIRVAEAQLALAGAEYDERVRQLRFEVRSRYAEYATEAERLRIVERLRDAYQRSLDLNEGAGCAGGRGSVGARPAPGRSQPDRGATRGDPRQDGSGPCRARPTGRLERSACHRASAN
jgi:cobalt-zinc-cadmium efflux system outer membrane protein